MRAFSLAGTTHLPVTGDLHPLRKEAVRWLTSANAFVLLMGVLIFGAWYAWSHLNKEEALPRGVQIVKFTELGVPPSIKTASTPQMNVADAVAPPTMGVPEPVPDEEATQSTIATQSQMSESLTPVSASDFGEGDSLVVDRGDREPAPGEFVPFDEYPVLLSIQPPEYPELARDAGISGTVTVQVLVGKDGKVKKAIPKEGPDTLMGAAVHAAKTALFKPALQGTSPVEVWVVIPITFSLQN